MTGLWEPVGGVFWSAPPDDRLTFLRWAIVSAFAAIAAAVIAVCIARRRKQPEWHLRQHMVEIGGAATLIYLVGIIVLTWGRIGTLGSMPLNEVGDFLAGVFGPVAFLWLVLGFLQQGEELRMQATELRNSVEQQASLAATAKQQIDMQAMEREIALKALFTFESNSFIHSRSEGWVQSKVRIKNEGKKALNATIYSDQNVNQGESMDLGDLPEGQQVEVIFDFPLGAITIEGKVWIEYDDATGDRRRETFRYAFLDTEISFVRSKYQS